MAHSMNPYDVKKTQLEMSPQYSFRADDDSSDDGLDFTKANELLPFDEAAESTLHVDKQPNNGKKSDTDSNEDNDTSWLTEVASLLNTKGPKTKQKNSSKEIEFSHQSKSRDEEADILPSDITRPVPLIRVRKGSRHGCKVVSIKDKTRTVAQVSSNGNSLNSNLIFAFHIYDYFRSTRIGSHGEPGGLGGGYGPWYYQER